MPHTNFFKYVFLGIFVIIILISVIDIKKSGNEYRTEKIEYYDREISGRLTNKWFNRGISIEISKNGKTKKEYLYPSKNLDLSPSNLYDFLRTNDSLLKPAGSLELFIYRNDRMFYFKLGENINE